jgi:hypothetical protein
LVSNAICSLLTDFVENGRFAALIMLCLFSLVPGFNFSLLLFQAIKLTKAAESIITEDSGALLQKRIVELEKGKEMPQRAVDHST